MATFVFTTPTHISDMLNEYLNAMPRKIEQDDPSGGVLRPWVRQMPLRLQGVLTTAIRGCDGAPKEDSSKSLSRIIRRAILNPADSRETLNAKGFFGFDPARDGELYRDFFHSLDQYPLHYVMHLCHACEVVAYEHPAKEFRQLFTLLYHLFCHTLHLRPEPHSDMISRLTEDRIANGTTARNF